ncbi:MAG: hypothetical protein Q9172_005462 [Xanthocarpia lactea]
MERERRRLPVTLSVPRIPRDTSDSDSDALTMERERRRFPTRVSVPRFFEDTFDSDSDSDGPTSTRSPESRMRRRLRRICGFPATETLEDKTCRICLSTFISLDRPARLPCGHILGFSCLTTWSVGRPVATCPICRAEYLDRVSVVTPGSRRLEIWQERSEINSELDNLYEEQQRLNNEQQRINAEQQRLNTEQVNLGSRIADLRERELRLRLPILEQFEAQHHLPSLQPTPSRERPDIARAVQTGRIPLPSQEAVILEPGAAPDIGSLETYLNRPPEEEL